MYMFAQSFVMPCLLTKNMFCYDMKSLGEMSLIFIEKLSFYFLFLSFQPKNVFYRNLHYPIQERLSLLISKRVSHNFAEKLLAMLICL